MALAEQVFGFFIPTVTLIGIGASKQTGERLKTLGAKKPLIVSDKGVTGVGITEKIAGYIKDVGLDYAIWDETHPNPTDKNTEDAFKAYKDNKCDSIVSLGGGSSHDCAKAVGLLAGNGGKIHDFEGVDKSKKPMPPFVAVNTTAGTASEMTRFCIITDLSRKVKMAIVDWRVTPNVAIDDPVLMAGMPPALTAATGMDALTHAVEAYVSTIATPITDACAIKAIELVAEYLPKAVAHGADMVARDKMAYAEYLAGMAFNNASLGHVHAMAHQLGGFYDLPHGVCNAILLPHVERFNIIAKMDRFADIARAMGVNTAGMTTREAAYAALDAIKALSGDVGIPSGLSELGVKEKDLKTMAENAQKDACGLTNPRCPTLEDVIQIYKWAM